MTRTRRKEKKGKKTRPRTKSRFVRLDKNSWIETVFFSPISNIIFVVEAISTMRG